jgi:hypothetical protein
VRSNRFPFRSASARAASFSARFFAATSLALAWPFAMLKNVLLSLIRGLDFALLFGFIIRCTKSEATRGPAKTFLKSRDNEAFR